MKRPSENYLEKVPTISSHLRFTKEENGLITLEIDNKGIMNKIAQTLFRKPKTSYIHLDEFGSFVWQQLDGEKTVLAIGEDVKQRFGEDAEPLYPRLAKYISILESYGFVTLK